MRSAGKAGGMWRPSCRRIGYDAVFDQGQETNPKPRREVTPVEHKGTKRLETERLILRPFGAADGPAMFHNWCNDPEVNRFLSWPCHGTVEVSCRLAAQWAAAAKKPDCYQWAIVPKALGEPAGSIAVVAHQDDGARAEIGYCLAKAWWGQGLMTEAAGAVIRYLIQEVGMERVEARHNVLNPASGRVMQKVGMTFQGIRHTEEKNNQGPHEVACYAISAQEWAEKNRRG